MTECVLLCDYSHFSYKAICQSPFAQPRTRWNTGEATSPVSRPWPSLHLSAPCTSIDSEHLFSAAAHVVDEKETEFAFILIKLIYVLLGVTVSAVVALQNHKLLS